MNIYDFDPEKTIRSYDYTQKAVFHVNDVIDSEQFEGMDSEMIFSYLADKMITVDFKDYLKRYIYTFAEIEEPFDEITDEIYTEIIRTSFREKMAPLSLQPTTRKESKIIRDFLNAQAVTRETVFALGFGLSMSEQDVADFLTKVNLESSYDLEDPTETIYWFCYKYELPYEKAKAYISYYDSLSEDDTLSEKKWMVLRKNPNFLINEEQLRLYLKYIRTFAKPEEKKEYLYQQFLSIYDRCIAAVSHLTGAKDVGAADIEKQLCCGIPITEKGNLIKMSGSLLARQFKNKRMTRQRINSILARKHSVERFDLITLLFLVYAIDVEPDWPVERSLQYIDEIDSILHDCGMMGIYPVNPYESFVLMCLITDYPLASYSDVLEKSYETGKKITLFQI